MSLHTIGFIAKYYGVSPSTIRRWEALGIIPQSIRTPGGHRRFYLPDWAGTESQERLNIGYARVSGHDQKSDLVRQAERLQEQGCDKVITDIGSGLNCSKPGLKQLLRLLLERRVRRLTVMHEDRLLRFGVGLVKFICEQTGTEFRVVNAAAPVSFEAELAKDVITLMTVFCARLYSRRARKKKSGTAVASVSPAFPGGSPVVPAVFPTPAGLPASE